MVRVEDMRWKRPKVYCSFYLATLLTAIKEIVQSSLVYVAFPWTHISLGDSLVLHCAFLLRTIFESSARAHECARVQNVTDFPQTKLNSEINDRFLLNEYGDPHFLFYKFNENNILINWEKIGRNLWLLFWQMK